MFSLLVHLHSGSAGSADVLASSGSTLGDYSKGDEFAGHSMLVNVSILSPELLEKEKQKAKQGYCETALWNCTDLWGP